MTAKEKLHERVDALSEEEAKRLPSGSRRVAAGDRRVGDLSAFRRASSASVFKHLDEEDAKAGFSWEQYR